MSSLLHKPPILHGLTPPFSQGSPSAGDGWETGNTLIFDGINDNVIIPEINSGDFTLSVWYNAVAYDSMLIGDINAGDHYIWIGDATRYGADYGAFKSFAVAIALNVWNHLLAVRVGANMSIYHNGGSAILQNPGADPMNFNRIGRFNGAGSFFDGKMDDLYLWEDIVGTEANAVSLYNGGSPVDPESVIPNADYKYLFNESSGTNLPDTGASENNGTLTNFADPDANWVSRL